MKRITILVALRSRTAFLVAVAFVLSSAAHGAGVWSIGTPGFVGNGVFVDGGGNVYADCGRLECGSEDQGRTCQGLAVVNVPDNGASSRNVLAGGPSGTVYASTYGGALGINIGYLYVSRNRGSDWTLLSQETFVRYTQLIPDPFDGESLYCVDNGLVVGRGLPVYPGRLQKSTNGGMNWTRIDSGLALLPERTVTAIAADPTTPSRLFAATAAASSGVPALPALFVTSDGGTTWTALPASLPGAVATLAVDPSRGSTVYARIASDTTGVFRSDDGGQSFQSLGAFATSRIVLDPAHPGQLYAATLGLGVEASTDRGSTWQAMNAGLTDLNVAGLAIDATRRYLYAATSSGVFSARVTDPETLVLDAAHPFTVTLTAIDQRTGRTGTGVATAVSDLWGYFSIPAITNNASNPEVFVKMLDGTALNGRYWFFYGGLTDLEYTLTVKEGATGLTRTYTKPAGSECGGSDTAAFGP
jgi:hypothetical protein